VLRVPPDPYLGFDEPCDSLDPALVPRRVEVRVCERKVVAIALDTVEGRSDGRSVEKRMAVDMGRS
jgi:hypothetical protein